MIGSVIEPWAAATATDTSEAMIRTRITIWVRKAKAVEMAAMAVMTAKVTRSTSRAECSGKMDCHPSRKPNTYMATASDCDRNSGRPIDPPTSSPSERAMMA